MGPLATPAQALWDIDNGDPKTIGGIRESTERLALEPGRGSHPQVGAGPGVCRDAGAAWPPNPRCPASRGAPQRHGLGRPGRGHARPTPRRPPAWSPGRSQPARPRPGGGVGAGGGARPVVGVRLLR